MNHHTPGLYHGKHYTQYVEDIKQLKREERLDEAVQLLLALIPAIENEARAKRLTPPSWYYEQLAIVYRKQKHLHHELLILDRYAQVCQLLRVPGANAFAERRAKAQALADKKPLLGDVVMLPLPVLTAEAFAPPPPRSAPVYQAPLLQQTRPVQTMRTFAPMPPQAADLSPTPGAGRRFLAWMGTIIGGLVVLVLVCQAVSSIAPAPVRLTSGIPPTRAPGELSISDRQSTAYTLNARGVTATPPPTARPTATKRPTATPRPPLTLTTGANFRSGPGVAFEPVRQLPAGTAVYLVQTREEAGERWFLVAADTPDGQRAWLSAAVLAVDPEVVAELPVNQATFRAPTPTRRPVAKPAPAPSTGGRTGAICRDGSRSSATGRGACSHHGGVAQWLYGP